MKKHNKTVVTRTHQSNPSAQSLLSPRVMQLLAKRKYADACEQLRSLSRSPLASETLGVCLLRSGQYEQAIEALRRIILTPGAPVVRPDASASLRVNFATALTLAGLPSGGLEAIEGCSDSDSLRLTQAIDQWASKLSFWQRLDWRFSRIEPRRSQVPLDFEPGVFPFEIEPTASAQDEESVASARLANPSDPERVA